MTNKSTRVAYRDLLLGDIVGLDLDNHAWDCAKVIGETADSFMLFRPWMSSTDAYPTIGVEIYTVLKSSGRTAELLSRNRRSPMTSNDKEFSVCQFFMDNSYEYVRRFVTPEKAAEAFRFYTSNVAAKIGTTVRVIITDGGDSIVAEWKHGEGLVFPPPDEGIS